MLPRSPLQPQKSARKCQTFSDSFSSVVLLQRVSLYPLDQIPMDLKNDFVGVDALSQETSPHTRKGELTESSDAALLPTPDFSHFPAFFIEAYGLNVVKQSPSTEDRSETISPKVVTESLASQGEDEEEREDEEVVELEKEFGRAMFQNGCDE